VELPINRVTQHETIQAQFNQFFAEEKEVDKKAITDRTGREKLSNKERQYLNKPGMSKL